MIFPHDISRAYEIATALIRYGFGDAVTRLGMNRILAEAGKLLRWQSLGTEMSLATPERLRRVLEELGPTFIKFGQILATRVDLFPPEYIRAFEKLQSQTAPIPYEEMKDRIQEGLGRPIESAFRMFNTECIGSASIAQVYAAELLDGTPVVVKVRRLTIRRTVEADLRLARQLAALAEKELPDLRIYRLVDMVEQFAVSLHKELDLAQEGRHADRARLHLPRDSRLRIPKVYWDLTSELVNVQERMTGIPGHDVDSLLRSGGDAVAIAQDGARMVSTMVVEDGFFHADPHPGNVFYLADGTYALLDWGMVGRLTQHRRHQIVDLLLGLVQRETDRVLEILRDWSTASEDEIEEERLLLYIEEFLDKYHSQPLDRIEMAAVFGDLTRLMRDNRISLPPDLALVFKVFITLEGFGRRLNPHFNLTTEARPILEKAIRGRFSPDQLWHRGKHAFKESVDLFFGLPREMRSMARSLRAGKVKVNLDLRGLEDFGQRVDDAASRLSVSFITAAFILSTSIVMAVGRGPLVYGVPLYDILGYGAMVGGLFVLFSMLRANYRRRKRK